ncbi:hypothetical protein EON64_17900, partial [archaeon]
MASELFPILLRGHTGASIAGITMGFVSALLLIHSLEYLGHLLEDSDGNKPPFTPSVEHSDPSDLITMPDGMEDDEENQMMSLTHWDDLPLHHASQAFTSPMHRSHIESHLQELLECITAIEYKALELQGEGVSEITREGIAEYIDEHIHSVQYKLDHCRRLLQGSEAEMVERDGSMSIPLGKREEVIAGVGSMKKMVSHMLEHMHTSSTLPLPPTLKELYIHMDYMDKQISKVHDSIEHVGSKWHHIKVMREEEGRAEGERESSNLPLSLIISVFLDCIVDGMLIGISTAVSLKAGVVLGLANSLE